MSARYFNLGWGRVESTLWHFMRLQTQFINHCDVEILPPYLPDEKERADPRLYADNVRAHMAAALGVELSSQGLREQQLLKQAGVCVDWTGRCLPSPLCSVFIRAAGCLASIRLSDEAVMCLRQGLCFLALALAFLHVILTALWRNLPMTSWRSCDCLFPFWLLSGTFLYMAGCTCTKYRL
jgi:hypothetical protein